MKHLLSICLLLLPLIGLSQQTVTLQQGQTLHVSVLPVKPDTIRVPFAVHDTVYVTRPPKLDTVVHNPPKPPVEPNLKAVITKSGQFDGTAMGVKPGDTVGIMAGTYTNLILKNFIGAPGKPIVFVNYKGVVRIVGTTQNNGNFSIQACQYWRLTGTGVQGLQYGFDISSSYKDVSALPISGKSTNFEIDHIEVSQAGFAGMMIKMDPSAKDPSTQLGRFTMYDIHIHDNYVHDTRGEGFYIGFSFWNNGSAGPKDASGNRIFPHEIKGLHLHHNIVLNAGCEGIQYSCSPGAQVHHNTVRKTGVSPFSNSQNAGVQISGGSSGDFYENTIDSAYGVGLMIVGALRGGDSLRIRNVLVTHSNVFAGAEKLPAETCAVFVDERPNPPGIPEGGTLSFTNVTIDGARLDGFRFYNQVQQNSVSKSVVRGFTRSAFDRSPKTVPLTISTDTITNGGSVPTGIGYQP